MILAVKKSFDAFLIDSSLNERRRRKEGNEELRSLLRDKESNFCIKGVKNFFALNSICGSLASVNMALIRKMLLIKKASIE